MLKMNEMPYVIGITMRLYPSNIQKDIISYNDGAARFIYHRLVARYQGAKTEGRSLRDSKNYQKQRLKVAYLHQKASAQNNNFQHVLTKHIIENQDIVVVEDLQIKNLMQNHRLARAIADCS